MELRLTTQGTNQHTVTALTSKGNYAFHFSYEACIAFKEPGKVTHVCENIWTPTTGRHLTELDNGDKGNRLSSWVFECYLGRVFENLGKSEIFPMATQ